VKLFYSDQLYTTTRRLVLDESFNLNEDTEIYFKDGFNRIYEQHKQFMTDWEVLAFGRRYQPPGSEWCSNLSAKNTIDPRNNSILSYSLLRDVRHLSPTSTRCTPIFIDPSSSSFSLAHFSVEPSSHFIVHNFPRSLKIISMWDETKSFSYWVAFGRWLEFLISGAVDRSMKNLKGRIAILSPLVAGFPRRRRSFRSFLYQPRRISFQIHSIWFSSNMPVIPATFAR